MKLLALLEVPWRSSHRSLRWTSILVVVFCSEGALAMALLSKGPDRWEGPAAICGLGLLFLWAFFLSTSLLLAIDARQLRVPRIQQQAVHALLLYGVLSIGLPTGVMGMFGAPVTIVLVTLSLLSVCGLAFAMMPRFAAIFMGLTPSLLNALWRRFDLPGFADPRFVPWAALATLVVLAYDVVRWGQLLRAGSSLTQGWMSPMVIQFRNGSWGQWNNLGDNRLLRQRPDWLRPQIDLDRVGPGLARNTLRVALGGWYLPQTVLSYVKQVALLGAILVLPATGVITLGRTGHAHLDMATVLQGALIGGLGSLSVIAGPLICVLSMLWLSRRWQRPNAELPLLALLPGLGDPGQAKRSLLRVGLGLPLSLHGLFVLLLVVAMFYWHGHVELLSFMLLAQLGTAAVTIAGVLNLFGGHMLKIWMTGTALTATFLLAMSSLLLLTFAYGDHPAIWALSLLPLLGLAWLLLGGAMWWLARRGWSALLRRPHAFLPG